MSKIYILVEVNTDGCTFSSSNPLCAFEDEDAAAVVAMELNTRCSTRSRTFETLPLALETGINKSAVKRIVKDLIKRGVL